MLGEFLDLLEFLDHVFRQHALADTGYVDWDGLRRARPIIGVLFALGQDRCASRNLAAAETHSCCRPALRVALGNDVKIAVR